MNINQELNRLVKEQKKLAKRLRFYTRILIIESVLAFILGIVLAYRAFI